jgi:hypothetical protein
MDRQKSGRYGCLLLDEQAIDKMSEAAQWNMDRGLEPGWDNWDILDLIATYHNLQAALAASRQKLKVKELALDYIAEKDMGLVMWAHNRASINAADQQD